MKTEIKNVTIAELLEGFSCSEPYEAWDGKLHVCDDSYAEDLYDDTSHAEVANSLVEGLPIGLMYWAKNGDYWTILDGKQRIISILDFMYCLNPYYHYDQKHPSRKGEFRLACKLSAEELENVDNYVFQVCFCEPTYETNDEWQVKMRWLRTRLNPVKSEPNVCDLNLPFKEQRTIAMRKMKKMLKDMADRTAYK